MGCGEATPLRTAFRVISLKVTRFTSRPSLPTSCATCQAMASPSRSGSVATKMSSASLAALRIWVMTLPFPRMVWYLGWKSFSTSMARSFSGRSRMCPMQASTL